MEEISLAKSIVCVDVERTRATYESIVSGRWQTCGCSYCRNFGAFVLSAFPAEVLEFFARAGVDPLKDAEVYEFGESRPGFRLYGGEFYLWAHEVVEHAGIIRETPRFEYAFTTPSGLVQDEFRKPGALCFHFNAELPWLEEEHAT